MPLLDGFHRFPERDSMYYFILPDLCLCMVDYMPGSVSLCSFGCGSLTSKYLSLNSIFSFHFYYICLVDYKEKRKTKH